MNISLLRVVDRHVGVGLIRIQNLLRKEKAFPAKPKKILIIKLFGFGNFIFLSPTLKALKQMFPTADIDILTFRPNAEICRMYSKYIDHVHTIDLSISKMGFELIGFERKNKGEYDLVVDFEQFVRLSAIIGRSISPGYFLGIATKNSKKAPAYDKFILYKEKNHIVEEYYSVARFIAHECGKKIDDIPRLEPPAFKSSKRAASILNSLQGKKLIGVCPGGRADDVERRYPKEMLAKALNSLASKRKDIKLVFFGGPSEKKDIHDIISGITNKGSCVDTSGTSLEESAALISRMDLFISNDTGPIHLAASLGVYCIGLYGPSKEWIYGPYTERKMIIRDKRHPPVRSNHNEKNMGWPREWWPTAGETTAKISAALKKI
jgi:ADP-heptose:LPS heptosyltransferase